MFIINILKTGLSHIYLYTYKYFRRFLSSAARDRVTRVGKRTSKGTKILNMSPRAEPSHPPTPVFRIADNKRIREQFRTSFMSRSEQNMSRRPATINVRTLISCRGIHKRFLEVECVVWYFLFSAVRNFQGKNRAVFE